MPRRREVRERVVHYKDPRSRFRSTTPTCVGDYVLGGCQMIPSLSVERERPSVLDGRSEDHSILFSARSGGLAGLEG